MHPLLAWDFFGIEVPIPLPTLIGISALIAAALLGVTHKKSGATRSRESLPSSEESKP